MFSTGDPHGIGPEILLKALVRFLPEAAFRPIIVGPASYLRSLRRDLKLSLEIERVEIVSAGEFAYPPPWGTVDSRAGQFAMGSLRKAVEYCRNHGHPLLVTPPISKRAASLAGFTYPGQTEFIASFFDGCKPAMAFFSDTLCVLLATAHIPLRDVPQALCPENLVYQSRLFYKALQRAGTLQPRIAFCGLNPHASEGGLFGDEEKKLLEPVLERLREEFGPRVFLGPFPSDTIFMRAVRHEFDGIVALYHDQGLIPLKLLAFDRAVNVTLGLPLTRTSPDHGTAFEIAGKFQADPASMIASIEWGLKLTAGLTSRKD
ncbi:MAG: 4-hydroxythreonine-4-phosphate dehydrogenase PdxA [Acidobacteria bacterium]|nr:4-hydroxythreonine-4-phosphate dehydrogenase PdxA [Acidobacteriota bacterium]